MPGPAKRISPLNRHNRWRRLDRRTREGRRELEIVGELTDHLGGHLTAPQTLLVTRAARLTTVIEMLEARLIEDGEVSLHASRQILAWVNSLRLLMAALGIERPERKVPSLTTYIGGKGAGAA